MLKRTEPEALAEFDTDESGALHAVGVEAIVYPANEAEVVEVVSEANRRTTPLTVSGGGTGITGARVATCGGLVLSTTHLREPRPCNLPRLEHEQFGQRYIVYFDEQKSEAVAPAGITLDLLAQMLPAGFFYPPDPTESTATLGGTIATNASGARTYHYGATRDWVQGLRVVLPSGDTLSLERGRVTEQGGRLEFTSDEGTAYSVPVPTYDMPRVKNAAGLYAAPGMDLVDLFIGCEGILGVVTEARLKLAEQPQEVASEIAFFSQDDDALGFLADLRAAAADGLPVLSIEYFDANSLRFMHSPAVVGEHAAAVYTEIVGTLDTLDPLLEALEAHEVAQDWFAETEDDRQEQRAFRHSLPEGINSLMRRLGSHKLGTDLVVPADRFPELLALYHEIGAEFRRYCPREGEHWLMFGHIGNYHLHFNFLAQNEQELQVAAALYSRLAQAAIKMGGTISGEHGVGKKVIMVDGQTIPYLQLMYGAQGIEEIAAAKRALDAQWLLNPGNMGHKGVGKAEAPEAAFSRPGTACGSAFGLPGECWCEHCHPRPDRAGCGTFGSAMARGSQCDSARHGFPCGLMPHGR